MNLFDTEIALKDEEFNKYGWTKKCRARYYLEKLHDLKKMWELCQNDYEVYLYILKRCIFGKRITLFKQLMPASIIKDRDEKEMQLLLHYTIKYKSKTILYYLIEHYKFTYFDFVLNDTVLNTDSGWDFDIYQTLYRSIIKGLLPIPHFSVWQSAYSFFVADHKPFNKFTLERETERFTWSNKDKLNENMTLPEYLTYFGYEKYTIYQIEKR